ncbi:unnamed protein product [Candidula unifasciata]|uniref:Uncharacterized protein n=1 Tax=Candidula unifasciata TaxID=100452 RepID=A0A8S3ZN00_9EUPU|nr:unnamed protein product [Candidula unifasciata]
MCERCGVCFTEPSQLATHRQRCGSLDRIPMPYDPPVENHYPYRNTNFYPRIHKNLNGVDCAKMDDEVVPDKLYQDHSNGDLHKKRKRKDDDENDEHRSPFRSNQKCILNLDKRMSNFLHDKRNTRSDIDNDTVMKERRFDIDSQDEKVKSLGNPEDNSEELLSKPFQNGEDPAVIWAMQAAEKGLFGGGDCLGVGSAASNSSTKSPCGNRLTSSGTMSDEVSMFHNMLFQLQQQQVMQIQMIQQMRRQLIANGINPNLLPADIDLKLMSSESLASVGAAMSGLQNHRLSLETSRDVLKFGLQNHRRSLDSPQHFVKSTPPPAMLLSTPERDASRYSSPLQAEVLDKREDDTPSPGSESSDKQHNLHLGDRNTAPFDSGYSKEQPSLTSLYRNPLEILQERTAASLTSHQLPLGLRSSSSSTVIKSSSSSLLNSNALFASSPSLSALQKETDALMPSPLLPPLSVPMSAEDYKGYIQRGTSEYF